MSNNKINTVVAAFAALLLVGGLGACSSSKAATPQPTAASSPAAPASPTTDHVAPTTAAANSADCKAPVVINSPTGTPTITNNTVGASFQLTTCLKPGEEIDALDLTDGDDSYTLDGSGSGSDGSVADHSGTFVYLDRPIGNDDDHNTYTTVTFVTADKGCQDTIRSSKPDSDGNVTFKQLPQGCKPAVTVRVLVLNNK